MPQSEDEKKKRTFMERLMDAMRATPKDEVLNKSERSQLQQLQEQETRERLQALQEEAKRKRKPGSLLSPESQ